MNSDFTFLLISAGAALVAGIVLGVLGMAIFRRSPVRAAPLVGGPRDEVLKIEADPLTRQLKLRISGLPVAGVDSIADVNVREHVRALMHSLALEPDAPAAPVTPPVAPVAIPLAPTAASAAGEPSSSNPTPLPAAPDDLSAPFLTRLTDSLRTQAAPAAVKLTPAPRPARNQPGVKPPSDVYEQINAILQRKLAAQSHAPAIEIYDQDGELRILVGGEVVRQVDAVTDEAARTLIRESVAEWEAG
jgi:hypothetical protein